MWVWLTGLIDRKRFVFAHKFNRGEVFIAKSSSRAHGCIRKGDIMDAGDFIETVLRIAKSSNTQDTLFKDKSEQIEDITGAKENSEEQEPPTAIKPKDFYWDQIVVILVSAILGLTVLDVTVEFFRGSGVQCFTPTRLSAGEDLTRDQASFVNEYCYRSLPAAEYYPVFIIIHGLLIVAPHYLWSSVFGGHFGFYFDLVKKLDRLRNGKTGDYNPENYDIVKKLENEFTHKQKTIFYSYIAKLIIQVAICLISIIINAAAFRDFSSLFTCPSNIRSAERWPLPSPVNCSYTPLRLLSVLSYADYGLVTLATFILLYGLGWCFVRHTTELGYETIAQFSMETCLLPQYFVPAKFWSSPRSPRIANDFDFLLMRLFRADTGHGNVFKDIQVAKKMKDDIDIEHALLHLFINVQKGNTTCAIRIKCSLQQCTH